MAKCDDFEKVPAGQTTPQKFVSETDSLKKIGQHLYEKNLLLFLDDDVRQLAFISLQDLKALLILVESTINSNGSLIYIGTCWLSMKRSRRSCYLQRQTKRFSKIRRNMHLSGTPFKAQLRRVYRERIYN